MNEAQASVLRTVVKCAAVLILIQGWPRIRKANVFNQTVIQPAQAEDLVMKSVILELSGNQPSDDHIAFRRVTREVGGPKISTDVYSMLVEDWEAAGRPQQVSITVSSLVAGSSV